MSGTATDGGGEFLAIEPAPELRMTLAAEPGPPEPVPPPPVLMRVLPPDFPLMTLLQFLPDVRLKQRADNAAALAVAIDVAIPGGLARADAALDDLRTATKEIEDCFEYPCSVAHQLHKRLTGLRTDFVKEASGAIEVVGRRVVDEKRRRDRIAEAERRRVQEEADRTAREAAQRAADEARRQQAPVGVQRILDEQAKTAVAPPVQTMLTETLATTAVTAKWRARPKGTPDDAPSNPDLADMTPEQQEQIRRMCASIAQGLTPLVAISVNWSYLNKRAAAEKTALDIPGIEAVDEGGLRKRK